MERREVIIVGSGPAGVAAAAALERARPALGAGVLVLEKERHPRHKLCGGGVTPRAEFVMKDLGLTVDVPSLPVDRIQCYVAREPIVFHVRGRLRMVRRNEFDAALVQRIIDRGIEVRQGERVTGLHRDGNEVVVETVCRTYRTAVVVGADGANGVVRPRLVGEERARVSRLLETLVPVDDAPEFRDRTAVFDFRATREHLQGYMWDFPALVDGRPHLNVGIFDSRVRGGRAAPLRALLESRLAQRGVPAGGFEIEGHPERWFAPGGRYSAPNVLLVGDAAGVEPWFGEGISFALAYGPLAAAAIVEAFQSRDFSFRTWADRIGASELGHVLRRNARAARLFYHPWMRPVLPAVARAIARWDAKRAHPPAAPCEA